MKKRSGPHIKPSHEGRLTKRLGTTSKSAVRADLAKAKRTGNVKAERQDVFALNASKWHHHGVTHHKHGRG